MESLILNTNRLKHLLSLYRVTPDELLAKLNEKTKRKLSQEDVFKSEIKISLLKKIDEIFNKGLSYYLDPVDPTNSKEESIFFRKNDFNANLSLGARQIVNKFEEDKLSFNTLSKLVDFKITRTLPVYRLKDNPVNVALEVGPKLCPVFVPDKKFFLSNFISLLAEFDVLVFEFVEAHNKKEKANIDGLFLVPNVIVLKRNQKALRREIFTLAHELGHYLLNNEEIDGNLSNEDVVDKNKPENETEMWCNEFAYNLLIGKFRNQVEQLGKTNSSNDYHHRIIESISEKTHLSVLALYTRLLVNGNVSAIDYKKIRSDVMQGIKDTEAANTLKLAANKQKALDEGRKIIMSPPKPIISPLYLQTLQGALFSGFISEQDFCKKLHIPANKLETYLV